MKPHPPPHLDSIIRDGSVISLLFSSLTDAVFVFDPDGRIIDCNSVFAKWQGVAPEDCIGTNIYDYLTPVLVRSRKAMVEEAIRTRRQLSFDDEKNGIRYRHTIYPDSRQGELSHLTVVAQLLTDDARRCPDHGAVLNFNRAIIESIPGAFFVLDHSGRYAAWNAFVRDVIVGRPENEMALADATSTIHPDDRPAALALMQNIFNSGSEEQVSVRILKHGGPDYIWLSMKGTRIIIEDRSFIIGTGTDITELRRLEALQAFRLRIVSMAENLPAGELLEETIRTAGQMTDSSIGLFHIFHSDDSTVRLEAWLMETGYTFVRTEPKRSEYPSGELQIWPVASGHHRSIIDNGLHFSGHRKGVPEGHPPIHRELLAPVIRGKKIVAILGVGNKSFDYDQDDARWLEALADEAWETIARKQAEQSERSVQDKMNQSQKMEMLGRLAGGVAHDLNNMLSVILGQTELHLVDPGNSSQFSMEMETIHKAASRSAELTRQLLAVARKQVVQPVRIDLNSEVGNLFAVLEQVVGENISLSWKPCGGRLETNLDPAQLNQILLPVCLNAREAISGKGNIIVTTSKVDVNQNEILSGHPCSMPGSYARLSISDTGAGLSKEHLPHIFEPFFTTKKRGPGTGLGLSTVYGIVKQNQCAIECLSEEGKGATFNIYLPLLSDHENAAASSRSDDGNGKPALTILLVEDEPDILKLMQTVLEKNSCSVLSASSAEKAILIAGEHAGTIDLLLTDVILPGMNGADLSKNLRLERPELSVLFMSGYTDDIIGRHGVFDKDVNFIQKPFSIKNLIAKVIDVACH